MFGFIGIAKVLISRGADINAPAAKYCGRTALEGAAEHGRLDIALYLLEENCLIDGSHRKQFIRAVGYARKECHQVLEMQPQAHGRWSQEDEQVLG
jgi:ankyrin repeat protein